MQPTVDVSPGHGFTCLDLECRHEGDAMQELASNLHDQMADLEREIAALEAARNKPHVTSVSSSASPSEGPGWSKTSRQIELESQLSELRRRVDRRTGKAKNESESDFDEQAGSREQHAAGEEPDTLQETSTIGQNGIAPLADPLAPARDRGAALQDILAFTWPGSAVPYVSANLGRLLRIAATRLDHDRILRPRQVFDALLHRQIGQGMTSRPSVFLPRIVREYSSATPTQLGQFDFPSETTIDASASNVIVGPELVAILLRMSLLREKTNVSYLEGGVRHFLAGLVLEEIGRVASDAAGLNFISWRDTLTRIIQDEIKNYVDLGDKLESWGPILDEMRQVSLPSQAAGETHAFANDRTEADLLNTGSDAAALADLLLLDDLKPPVAVGVFGPWGSGKSTLIRLLKDQIAARTSPEPNVPAAPKVVQINFDAWSHADAENLWASLTAELFDQLADAIDGRAPDGKLRTGLITEIAKRLRRDAEASPLVEGAIELQREAIQAAETKLAGLEHEPVAATVAGEMAKELITKATPKELSDKDKRDPNKRREAEKAEAHKKRLDELLQACGVPTGERDPEKLASLLSGLFDLPSRAGLLFVLLRRSLSRGIIYGLTAALAVLTIGVGGAIWYLGWGRFPEIWTYIVSAFPSVAVLGTLIGTAAIAIRTATPILSLAAEFLARKEKRAAELNKERREASELVKKEREKLDAMIAEQKKATEFAASYSLAAEGRSREGLLRYFITYSPELAEVRKKLGLLATVRRCFETLEQIMHEKRAAAPAEVKPAEGNSKPAADKVADLTHVPEVRRIIVYIDDLDRCSEQHVVQVLQAIHLLLAFDLFVVVVAVDARWLHRAVGKVYSGQLAVPGQPGDADQPVQLAGATVADYLEKIFQLPIWMQSISNPGMVETFVSGIDRPEEEPTDSAGQAAGDKGGQQGHDKMVPIDVAPDPTLFQTAAQRRATMSKFERRALAAMAPLAGKSPRGLKRLVNTYRLIRVMRGPTGIADLEAGGAGKTPLYPYLLFALACEVGLTTETAALVAEIAGQNLPTDGLHPLVACLLPNQELVKESLDDAQIRLRERLNDEGMRAAVLTALRAVYVAAAGRDPSETRVTNTGPDISANALQIEDEIFVDRKTGSERFAQAFAEAARFTFRPRNR
ncbi:P-loop NTPase fold protein [Bradyrhizobium guangdongense]|uniref:P-loop NTPase fold protein n=1 Tax=Bradyrhizobium guangdongense TaxID=1325090 RepID=UPI001642412F|nr:P-loop NTPase fold protein [Bradyrhizobium guangdongense]